MWQNESVPQDSDCELYVLSPVHEILHTNLYETLTDNYDSRQYICDKTAESSVNVLAADKNILNFSGNCSVAFDQI